MEGIIELNGHSLQEARTVAMEFLKKTSQRKKANRTRELYAHISSADSKTYVRKKKRSKTISSEGK